MSFRPGRREDRTTFYDTGIIDRCCQLTIQTFRGRRRLIHILQSIPARRHPKPELLNVADIAHSTGLGRRHALSNLSWHLVEMGAATGTLKVSYSESLESSRH